ncbi:hypothetical protein PVAND_011552 [Polypedilum vanderplanki]|uniref:Ig-like domain-containing protein n=1 Tax=Polypedilum vanderplanki TaxID=319348 RepID=A0A9J6CJT8_POLVA|nr:hypothetical protein PVAND_011552 [Polypedilum vanderplanki]
MRRRKELYILHSNTVLTAIVFFSLLIDAKDLTSTQTEANINLTEAFDNTMETSAIESTDNESQQRVDGTQSATPTDSVSMTSQTTMQNRLHLASVTTSEQLFAVSNAASSFDTTSTYSTKFHSTNNTIPSNDNDSKNFSNTSFSVKTTTMKPFIIPTLPDYSRHRMGHKQYQSKSHHDRHFGPFFEDPLNTSGTLQLKFHEGTESILNCRVGMLKDKTVMWVRRTVDKVSLLTVGNVTYSGDPRIKVMFIYPNNWRLSINPITPDDGGLYMCQVSTHPPRVFATNLTVLAKAIHIVDEMGHEVSDRYYKLGSSVDVTCQVALSFLNSLPPSSLSPMTNLNDKFSMTLTTTTSTTTTTVFPFIDTNLIKTSSLENIPYNGNHIIKWKKDGKDLPKDIKINLSTTHVWRNSRISIIHAEKIHSGTYTCFVTNSSFSSVNIQILMGETPAAVQHNHCSKMRAYSININIFILPLGMMLIFYKNFYISEL